ncbi:MAG TPA: hypothetical protein VLD39_15350, partial [Gammaproteobacteria bacterium]|nr:hypothetical protein [Gammaproteobacteria bacterium]
MRRACALACLLAPLVPVQADREPVLGQVDLPHSYYWRELYLPQLTTGPSSASFLPDGRERPLTTGGAVNVEPRLSPDGRRLAWVSTAGSGRFNLYVATLGNAGLEQPRPLTDERRSLIDRYYYSPFDHAINPSWSPDGARLFYVGNPEVAWGSGDLWSVSVDDPDSRRRILS